MVIFLDADDYLFPHTVERVVAIWRPSVAKIHYRLDTVDTDGRRFGFESSPHRLLSSGDVLPITSPTNEVTKPLMSDIKSGLRACANRPATFRT
jgi:hypothetical protein